jgi:hypothetical protein
MIKYIYIPTLKELIDKSNEENKKFKLEYVIPISLFKEVIDIITIFPEFREYIEKT